MPTPSRSVAALAARIGELAEAGEGVRAVTAVVGEADLTAEDRVALVVTLLNAPSDADPHPADLAVCAFVALGFEDFTTTPTGSIDLREVIELWLDLRSAEERASLPHPPERH